MSHQIAQFEVAVFGMTVMTTAYVFFSYEALHWSVITVQAPETTFKFRKSKGPVTLRRIALMYTTYEIFGKYVGVH